MTALHTGSFHAVLRALLLSVATGLLAGCISLFPQAEPAQLYRFGTTPPQVQKGVSGESSFGVLLSGIGFDRAAASDRILTVTGTQVAYIKGSRWVTSAQDLFDSAVKHAFDADQGPARLLVLGELGKSNYALKLDVRTFQVNYDNGKNAAPTIVIELRASLANTQDQNLVSDKSFNMSVPASDNRVGAIAEAFDLGVTEVLQGLVTWVNTQGEDTPAQAMAKTAAP